MVLTAANLSTEVQDTVHLSPAAVLHRTESTRNCWASSRLSSKVCTVIAGLLPLPASGYCLPLPTAKNLFSARLCHGR
jgi:hypothetical protein